MEVLITGYLFFIIIFSFSFSDVGIFTSLFHKSLLITSLFFTLLSNKFRQDSLTNHSELNMHVSSKNSNQILKMQIYFSKSLTCLTYILTV